MLKCLFLNKGMLKLKMYCTSLQAESDEQDVTPEVAAGDKEPSESALPSEPRPSVSTSSSGGNSHME